MALRELLLAPRTRLRTLFALLVLSLALAAGAGWQWWRLARDDARAAAGGVAQLPLEQALASPTLRFARARELAAANDFEGALAPSARTCPRTMSPPPFVSAEAKNSSPPTGRNTSTPRQRSKSSTKR